MEFIIGLLVGIIPAGLTLAVSLLGFVRLRKAPNFLIILLSALVSLVIWFIWLLVVVGVSGSGKGDVMPIAFLIGSLLEVVAFITIFVLVREKRCPACKFMAADVSGEPEVLDKVHDIEVVRRPNGNTQDRMVTRFLLEVPYTCENCGHEWTRRRKVKRAGHVE